jgi:hypothetical protein
MQPRYHGRTRGQPWNGGSVLVSASVLSRRYHRLLVGLLATWALLVLSTSTDSHPSISNFFLFSLHHSHSSQPSCSPFFPAPSNPLLSSFSSLSLSLFLSLFPLLCSSAAAISRSILFVIVFCCRAAYSFSASLLLRKRKREKIRTGNTINREPSREKILRHVCGVRFFAGFRPSPAKFVVIRRPFW